MGRILNRIRNLLALAAVVGFLGLVMESDASAQCGVRQQVQSSASSQDLLGQLLASGALNGGGASSAASVASAPAPQFDANTLRLAQLLAQQQRANSSVSASSSSGGPRLTVLNTGNGASSASASAVAGGANAVNTQDLIALASLLDQSSAPSVSASSASASNACASGNCGGGRSFRPLANLGGRRQVSRSTAITRTFSR